MAEYRSFFFFFFDKYLQWLHCWLGMQIKRLTDLIHVSVLYKQWHVRANLCSFQQVIEGSANTDFKGSLVPSWTIWQKEIQQCLFFFLFHWDSTLPGLCPALTLLELRATDSLGIVSAEMDTQEFCINTLVCCWGRWEEINFQSTQKWSEDIWKLTTRNQCLHKLPLHRQLYFIMWGWSG